jgi:amino acid transporter
VVAVANGVLIEILMLGRLLYGMARRGWLPAALAAVTRRQRAPVAATVIGGALILLLTVGLPFGSLVSLTSAVTLTVFAVVNLALWRLQGRGRRQAGFRVPRVLPPLAAMASLALAASQLLT